MKTMQEYIEEIQAMFSQGHRVVEIPAADPFRFRCNLYKAARKRGLLWRFALTSTGVAVVR